MVASRIYAWYVGLCYRCITDLIFDLSLQFINDTRLLTFTVYVLCRHNGLDRYVTIFINDVKNYVTLVYMTSSYQLFIILDKNVGGLASR